MLRGVAYRKPAGAGYLFSNFTKWLARFFQCAASLPQDGAVGIASERLPRQPHNLGLLTPKAFSPMGWDNRR